MSHKGKSSTVTKLVLDRIEEALVRRRVPLCVRARRELRLARLLRALVARGARLARLGGDVPDAVVLEAEGEADVEGEAGLHLEETTRLLHQTQLDPLTHTGESAGCWTPRLGFTINYHCFAIGN